MMRTLRLGLVVTAAALAAPAGAATLLTESLVFSTGAPISSAGATGNPRFDQTYRATETWNATGRAGGIATTEVLTPQWIAWKVCKETVDIFCGGEPRRVLGTVRNGAEFSLTSRGEAGVEVRVTADAGSARPQLTYGVGLVAPDDGEVEVNELWAFAPTADLLDGKVNIQSPTASIKVDTVLGVTIGGSVTSCVVSQCAIGSLPTGALSFPRQKLEIIDIDPNRIQFGEGFVRGPFSAPEVPLFSVRADLLVGASPPYIQAQLSNGLSTPAIPGVAIDIANIETRFPSFASVGRLESDGRVRASGQDQNLSAALDLDGLFPGPRAGVILQAGPASVSVDAYDIEAGPTVSFFQDAELRPGEVLAEFFFSNPVIQEGVGVVDRWAGRLADLPRFAFLAATRVFPRYYVDAAMKVASGYQFGIALAIEVAKAGYSIGPLKQTIGPVYSKTLAYNPNFARTEWLNTGFFDVPLVGIAGESFVVRPRALPPPPPPLPLPPIPLPAAGWLLLVACASLVGLRRKAS